MENPQRPNRKKNSKLLFVSLSAAVLLTVGCKLTPLKIDPCAVYPPDPSDTLYCRAVPINQPEKPEYDRTVNPGDICVSSDEYGELQKSYRDLMRRCGDRCK